MLPRAPDALQMLRDHAHATLQQLTEEVCAEAGVVNRRSE